MITSSPGTLKRQFMDKMIVNETKQSKNRSESPLAIVY